MRRSTGVMAAAVAGLLVLNGCYGPFYLVRKVHKFNGEVSSNKWVVEVAYLLMTWLPVYGLAGAADAILFNSLEFWTGDNPMAPKAALETLNTKRLVRGSNEILLSKQSSPSGDTFLLQQLNHGQPGQSLRIQRSGDKTIAYNQAGEAIYQAQTLADGGVLVSNTQGEQVGRYSNDQVNQFFDSTRQ